ncbi:MAG: hypothetical protein CM15mP74_06340 [Halieaceae bacterium]|nr:MAG: hypothetical protein CM15mP74_06340 [Halieaceae bacterium]
MGLSLKNLKTLTSVLFLLLSVQLFAQDGDGDGISDADELALGTNPNVADDYDGDGIYDFFEDDADGDGVPDDFECFGNQLADYTLENRSFEIP